MLLENSGTLTGSAEANIGSEPGGGGGGVYLDLFSPPSS